jgi:serine O-acetyltransferase
MKTNLIERLEQAHSVYDQQISKARTVEFVEQLLEVLFPGFGKKHGLTLAEIEWSFEKLEKELLYLLRTVNPAEERQNIFRVTQFFEKLENVYLLLLLDVKAISEGDPAAKDEAEVIQSYPGFFAIAVYRIAHLLWN